MSVSSGQVPDPDPLNPPPLPPPVPLSLLQLPTQPCPYLPDRMSRFRGMLVRDIHPGVYHQFMNRGFRRSGHLIYQPVCTGCRQCIPIRVAANDFKPDKSQRRCWRRNADLKVSVGRPTPTDENFALYQKYIAARHGSTEQGEAARASFESFLYQSPVHSLEFSYRFGGGELSAVGIADVCPESFSSVYFYFDPELGHRSLGTYGAMFEIEWARQNKIAHYYLGFWVPECPGMKYKANFRPFQALSAQGEWIDQT